MAGTHVKRGGCERASQRARTGNWSAGQLGEEEELRRPRAGAEPGKAQPAAARRRSSGERRSGWLLALWRNLPSVPLAQLKPKRAEETEETSAGEVLSGSAKHVGGAASELEAGDSRESAGVSSEFRLGPTPLSRY